MAQLAERSLPIPEISGSNPDLGEITTEHLFTVNFIEKTKRENEAGNGPL